MAKKNQTTDNNDAKQAAADNLKAAHQAFSEAESIAKEAKVAYEEASNKAARLKLDFKDAKTAARKAGVEVPRSMADL